MREGGRYVVKDGKTERVEGTQPRTAANPAAQGEGTRKPARKAAPSAPVAEPATKHKEE